MRIDSLSLKYYLNSSSSLKNGQYAIFLRVMVNRKKVEISTRQYIDQATEWDGKSQRVNGNNFINSRLGEIEAEIKSIYYELKHCKKPITAFAIKHQFLGRDVTILTLHEYFEKTLNERIETNKESAFSTIQNYRTTYMHLKKFLINFNLRNISLSDVNESVIRKFDIFLMETKLINSKVNTLSRASVNKYHKKLRALFSMAIEDGLITNNPYRKFRIKNQESARTYLTKAELNRIEEHDLGGNQSLKRARDKFLFSVYTGMRFTDADNLMDENVEYDGKKYWINFTQQKTKEPQRIPMLEKAKLIYDKYEFERLVSGYVLPRLSNQKVNAYLKTIADLAEIKKPLTHHVARHTSATTIFLSNGVPLEVVSKQLGHSSIKTTEVYAKITNSMLSNAVDKLDKILK